jgi:4-amino-4-deoxy-L-arabinose transferase-like glycosyltransferase
MVASIPRPHLGKGGYGLLCVFCLVLFGYPVLTHPVMTGHMCVLPQNAREMAIDHDWLIPKAGGQPWLERPPLVDWIIVAIDWVCGRTDSDQVARIGPALAATAVVVLVGWMAAVWYGRTIGLLAGMILATMWEFFNFASDPESDMFLCAIVAGVLALFVYLEFVRPRAPDESRRFLGGRPWPVLAFFVLLGLTNLAKGLIFGTLMAVVPVGCFLLWNGDWAALRRYVWLWGWLAFVVVSAAWPVAAYVQHPEIWQLWTDHYLGRLYRGYIGEPVWYYLAVLPYVILPWTPAALTGLWGTRSGALRRRGSAERLLWSWALATPVVFSIPDGKHHHYLLHSLVPWAVLAALGAVAYWQWLTHQGPAWLRTPLWSSLVLAVIADGALAVLAPRIEGPSWLVPALLVALPAAAFAGCWAATSNDGRVAAGGLLGLVLAAYVAQYSYQTWCLDAYRDDTAFLREVHRRVPCDRPLLVNYDMIRPLETFWLLFYSEDRVGLLSDVSDLGPTLRDYPVAYVIGRDRDRPLLARVGSVEPIVASKHTRGEESPADRRTLFRVRAANARPAQQPQHG